MNEPTPDLAKLSKQVPPTPPNPQIKTVLFFKEVTFSSPTISEKRFKRLSIVFLL